MRKLLIPLFVLLPVSLFLPGCGSSTSSTGNKTSGLHFRAFLSNNVSAGTSIAGVYIVDAQNDRHPGLTPITAGSSPGMMVVTPNRATTLVFSGNNTQFADNQIGLISNAAEGNTGNVSLGGYTESIVVSPDSSTAYVAVPTAAVVGGSPGVMRVINLSAGALTGAVSIPSVHYLSLSNSGNRILAFSTVLSSLAAPCTDPTPSFVFVVTPSDIGVQPCPVVPVPGFDHPVQAAFSSDDSTAYVVNCGAECGGTQASVQTLNMTTNTPGTPVGVCVLDENKVQQCAASMMLVDGSTMYLAGTPYSGGVPSLNCNGQQTAARTCGMVTVFDLNSMSVVNPAPIRITDGWHNRMALGANGQLFIGARTCTEIFAPQPPPQGAEIRGCLSIYNTQTGAVVIPPANGDATGIQPIATRPVVYVVQGGALSIYDTTTDALQFIQITNLVGNFIDVKTIDF